MLKINGKDLEVINYPNGEFGIKNISPYANTTIKWIVEEPFKEILQILFIKQHINTINYKFKIITDYLPFSREDKFINGQLPTFKYLLELFELNKGLSTTEILTYDLHSTLEEFTKSIETYKSLFINFINRNISNLKNPLFVFPDKSSYKKYSYYFQTDNQIKLKKVRDESTGKITKIEIDEFNSKYDKNIFYDLVIIDDICSYGGTFIGAVKEINKNDIKINSTTLFTIYDELQEKSDEFKDKIQKHLYIKTINFKGVK